MTIPEVLVGELAAHLNKYVGPDDDALVFVGERGGTPKRGSWRSTVKWTERVEDAGLPAGFTFHDLRHTGNHLASMSGASTRELMQPVGHSTMRAALIYQHATDERAREIANRLDEVVERQTKAADGGHAWRRGRGGRSAGPEHLGHVEGRPPETDLGMTKAPSLRIPVAGGLSVASG